MKHRFIIVGLLCNFWLLATGCSLLNKHDWEQQQKDELKIKKELRSFACPPL